MTTIQAFFGVLLFGSLLSGCRADSTSPATPFVESIKGYELYSWQDGKQWNFSLLVGTNREKKLDEIKSAKTVLRGVDALTRLSNKCQKDNISPGHPEKRCPFRRRTSSNKLRKSANIED